MEVIRAVERRLKLSIDQNILETLGSTENRPINPKMHKNRRRYSSDGGVV